MKFDRELIRKAHKMTREIKAEYKDVDYRTQYGLCLSYLLQEEEINEMENMENEDYKIIETKKEVINDIEYEVPTKILKKWIDTVLNITWKQWSNYGKTRLYAYIDGSQCGYLDITNAGEIKNELKGHLGKAYQKLF